ncbi:MAG TPA: serine/threonine-protein kinase [Thermoanaerobaculia bacterium]|nr:serine/threonine-protein kinase [Thermoanaerobaculia bacterium]
MTWLSDPALSRLREAVAAPDLSATRYELVATLGRGGMATVYLARDRNLQREVALKVLDLPEAWTRVDAGGAERLAREACVLAQLEHPGIVPVHEMGLLPDGRAFYAMRRVRGSRLDAWAESATLPAALRAFERICEAVAFAHAHGVLHRDLKPANVMVGPFGEVLVLDWGVAKRRGEAEIRSRGDRAALDPPAMPDPPAAPGATAAGTVLGTPGYMAPEQERGELERIDERTDVFGLGAILEALLARVALQRVPPPLRAIVAKAKAPLPEQRYASAEDLAADLRHYVDGAAVLAHREGPVERAGRLVRRYRTPILIVLTYLAARALLLFLAGR